MKQITVRNVQDRCVAEAKKRARQRGVAMNTILVEALEAGLGIGVENATNGLERYSGDSDFGPDWDERMAETSRIDPEDWK